MLLTLRVQGLVGNRTMGYYLGRIHLFLLAAGVKEEHLRFRQHLPTEMAHYASDCWDAECETSYVCANFIDSHVTVM